MSWSSTAQRYILITILLKHVICYILSNIRLMAELIVMTELSIIASHMKKRE